MNMRLKQFVMTLGVSALTLSGLLAGTVNFDDFIANQQGQDLVGITNYGGLFWSDGWSVTDGYTYDANRGYYFATAFSNAVASASNVVFSDLRGTTSITNTTPFNLTSGVFTSAGNNDVQIAVIAYKNGSEVSSNNYTINVTQTNLSLNIVDATEVDFVQLTQGNNAPGYSDGFGTFLILDNLVVGSSGTNKQTITFTKPASQTYSFNKNFALNATAPGGPVTFTSSDLNVVSILGSTATITGVGTAFITANQAGNTNYAPAPPVTNSVTVSKGSQKLSAFPIIPTVTYGVSSFAIDPPVASSGIPVNVTVVSGPATITNDTVTITGAGVVKLVAYQAGNDFYSAALPATALILVNKANQTINFAKPPSLSLKAGSYVLTANAQGGTVTFTSSNSKVISISGNLAILKKAGTAKITATQSGNSNYKAATPVSYTMTVLPSTP